MKQHLEKALQKQVDWVGDHTMYALLADGAARQQEQEGLSKYAPLAEETALRYDHTLYLAIAHRAWGVHHRLSGDLGQAEARLNKALALFQELETRWQTGLTLVELGQIAIEKSNGDQARAYFSKALNLFNEMDARPDANRVQKKLASLG